MSSLPPGSAPSLHALVSSIDHLARRWLATIDPNKGTVFSPVGLWPLLAILADCAVPEVQAELAGALKLLETHTPTAQALTLLTFMHETRGLSAAAGVWLARDVPPSPEFVARLPPGAVQALSGNHEEDMAALAAWATQALQGLLGVEIGLQEDTQAYLASAVTLATKWRDKFHVDDGWLVRSGREERAVRTCDAVTTVRIGGQSADRDRFLAGEQRQVGAHDVHLVIGRQGVAAGEVLALGLDALRGLEPLSCRDAPGTTPGPGLAIRVGPPDGRRSNLPNVSVRTPQFRVQAKTELKPPLLGLVAACASTASFPGISDAPLIFTGGSQTAMAEFSSQGFVAAAFTQTRGVGSAPHDTSGKTVHLDVNVDRPFGFLAVEPYTGILLFAGWVTEEECSWAER